MDPIPADILHALKQVARRSLSAADLTDAELALIEAAEIPAEHRYSIKDLE